jgi:outer membrane lipoprotein carrier protein
MHRLVAAFSLLLVAAPAFARGGGPKAAPGSGGAPAKEAAAKDPAQDLAARIQKFYETTKDLHARFEQTMETGVGKKRTATGELWLKKPGRMRWEYQKPERKLMVADGQSLWVYEPEDQQAFRQSLTSSSLPSSVSFLWGQGRLADEFDVAIEKAPPAGVGGEGITVLKLVPKKATAQYRYLLFAVNDKTGMVVETVIFDQQGGTNDMKFRDIELNKNVGDDKFKFTPPVGTRILRP